MKCWWRCIPRPLCTHRCLRGAGCSPHIVVRPRLGPGHKPELKNAGVSGHKAQCCSHGGPGPVPIPLSPSLPCMVIHGDGKGLFHSLLLNGTAAGAGESWGPVWGLQSYHAPIPVWVLFPVAPISGCKAQDWGNGGPVGWACHQQGYKLHTSLDIGDILNIIFIITGGLDWSADLEMGLERGGDKGSRPAACKELWSGILHSTGKPNLLRLIGKSLEICWGAGHRLPGEGSEVSVRSTIPEVNWKGWGGAGKQISCHNESPLSARSATVLRCVRIYIHVLLTILQCNETFYLSDLNLCHMLVQTVQLKPRRV